MEARPITVLAGGVGGARFLQGLVDVVPARDVTVLGNVGDDLEPYGLHVSPDLDTVLYTLAGEIDEERGWGVRGDSERALARARRLGAEGWFWLGDLDLGLHLARTERLRQGEPLSRVTAALAAALGLEVALLPASDDPVRTMVETPEGELDFQTYYVRRRHADTVRGVRFAGAEAAAPAPGVLEALAGARVVLLAPSNPLISIGPILAVPGVRAALASRRSDCVAVSPIVGGRALRGPLGGMLASLGHEVSAVGVARLLGDVAGCLLVDEQDRGLLPEIEALGMRAVPCDAVMRDRGARAKLARAALEAAGYAA